MKGVNTVDAGSKDIVMMHFCIQWPMRDAQKVDRTQSEEDRYLSMCDAERELYRKAMVEKMHNLNICCSLCLPGPGELFEVPDGRYK